MSLDRKFDVLRPDLTRLVRASVEIDNTSLVNPTSTSPLALTDGELVQFSTTGKYKRATDAAVPSFFWIEDRGDFGVQASRKGSAIMGGGSFLADTVLFNSGLTSIGTKLMYGDVTLESYARACLIAQTGSNVVIGYTIKPAAINGGKLQFLCTLT